MRYYPGINHDNLDRLRLGEVLSLMDLLREEPPTDRLVWGYLQEMGRQSRKRRRR